MNPRPPFPKIIDNTIRSTFVSCPRKAFMQYFQHWGPKGGSIHLHAGGAFARGLEVTRDAYYNHNYPEDKALLLGQRALIEFWGDFETPEDSPKSLPNMIAALDEYFSHYPMSSDHIQPYFQSGQASIEFSFALPIPIPHPETGEDIIYSGRFDLLGVFNDQLFVVDEKTTGQLGASWPKQWALRSQFTGYVWGAKQFSLPVAGAIVRGLAIYKKGFGHAESVQYRPDWMVDQWYEQLLRDVRRMISSWESGYWDLNLADACSSYGGCPFLPICTSQNGERWLEENFEKREWEPLGGVKIHAVR